MPELVIIEFLSILLTLVSAIGYTVAFDCQLKSKFFKLTTAGLAFVALSAWGLG